MEYLTDCKTKLVTGDWSQSTCYPLLYGAIVHDKKGIWILFVSYFSMEIYAVGACKVFIMSTIIVIVVIVIIIIIMFSSIE